MRAAGVTIVSQLQLATNDLTATQEAVSSLRETIRQKRVRLRNANQCPHISPEMVALLNGEKSGKHSQAWAELRQMLGLGWDASPDYVLVSKQAIQSVWYKKLLGDATLSTDSIELLNLTADEQAAISAALARAREGEWLRVQSAPPSGDIVAQLTITPPDPSFVEAQSNSFAADITSAIGADRANLFLTDAWREFHQSLAPSQNESITISQTTTDGQPDLVYDETVNGRGDAGPVRYATYPAFPILQLFPAGGWKTMSQALGFDLPPAFMSNRH